MPASPRSWTSPCRPAPAPDPIAWPAPRRQPEGPVMTYGYSGEVLLPPTVRGAGRHACGCTRAGWSATISACRRRAISASTCPPGMPPPRRRRRCSPPPTAPMPRPSPWSAQIAPDGTLISQRRRHLARDGARRPGSFPPRPAPSTAPAAANPADGARGFHARAETGRGVPSRAAARRRAGGARCAAGSRPRWTITATPGGAAGRAGPAVGASSASPCWAG